MKALRLLAVYVAAITTAAHADDIPRCRTPENIVLVQTLSKAPRPLRATLASDVGQMAEPKANFNATDSIDPRLPPNRLIFIWNRADLWIVAAERGGIAYSDTVVV